MPVAATSYEAQVSAALVQMLADSTTWETLVGTPGNATGAKAFIFEDDGGAGDDNNDGKFYASDGSLLVTTGVWATVRIGAVRLIDRAQLTWGREGDFVMLLVLRKTANDTPAEVVRRARNTAGAIRDEMQALFSGSAARLAYGRIDVDEIVLADETGALSGAILCPFKGYWRDCP